LGKLDTPISGFPFYFSHSTRPNLAFSPSTFLNRSVL
jgi:hypothetical protein